MANQSKLQPAIRKQNTGIFGFFYKYLYKLSRNIWNFTLPDPIAAYNFFRTPTFFTDSSIFTDQSLIWYPGSYNFTPDLTITDLKETMASFISSYAFALENALRDPKTRLSYTYIVNMEYPNLRGMAPDSFFKKCSEFADASENFVNLEREIESLSENAFPLPLVDRRQEYRSQARKFFVLIIAIIRNLLQQLEDHGWIEEPPSIDPYTFINFPTPTPESHKDFEAYTKIILSLEVAMALVTHPQLLLKMENCSCSVEDISYHIHTEHHMAKDFRHKIRLDTIKWDPSYQTIEAYFNTDKNPIVYNLQEDKTILETSDVETQPGSPKTKPDNPASPASEMDEVD